MNDNRPDPQQLLDKINQQESKKSQGKLKIFLGAAAGVGKTYAMLKAASLLQKDNIDVVIGYIETHNRKETTEVVPSNIEFISPAIIEYKNNKYKEFDLDAALKRHPEVIIVDELAHTNNGTRNKKRYQDILELLNAGIDVYTAINIQHIESLNNIVEQITGIPVAETVPDHIIEDADEIVLIDLPPDELIERLNEGKIYSPERAKQALRNFFRKGNLTALRELALRKTAQKVDQQVQEYRYEQDIKEVWPSNDKLLVVIEPGYSSEKIIRSAKNVIDKGYNIWYAGYFENSEFKSRSLRDRQKVLDLLDLAKQLGAIPVKLYGPDPASAIIEFLKDNNINTVMLAQYRLSLYYRLFGSSLSEQIVQSIPEINLLLVNEDSIPKVQFNNQGKIKKKFDWGKTTKKFFSFLIFFALFGIAIQPLSNLFNNTNIAMLYLFVLILVSKGRGVVSAIIVAIMSAASYNFYFITPKFQLVFNDAQYVITFIIMASIGIVASVTNGNLRYQISQLNKEKYKNDTLFTLCKELSNVMIEAQAIEILSKYLELILNAKYMLLTPDMDERLQIKISKIDSAEFDINIANWVFTNNQSAGINTDTFAISKLFYVPIASTVRGRGVLVLEPLDEINFFLPETQLLLERVASLIASTLERIHFTQIAIETKVALAKNSVAQN